MNRRDRILAHVALGSGPGLEIGPCVSPLVTKDMADVRYVDHLETAALRAKFASPQFLGEVPVDEIPEVDVVWNDARPLDQVLPPPRPVQWVVASHVVEHAPNLVRWLGEIERVLAPGGVLALAIPDKRFTFDVPRAESTFGDVLEAHLTNARHPRLKSVYDYFATAVRVAPEDLARPVIDPEILPPYYSEAEAVARVMALAQTPDYVDIHNLVVTPWSFRDILAAMMRHDLTGFEVRAFAPTEPRDFEFFVTLARPPEGLDPAAAKARQLASLPDLGPSPEALARRRALADGPHG